MRRDVSASSAGSAKSSAEIIVALGAWMELAERAEIQRWDPNLSEKTKRG